ncbi:hypothetical protein CNMCM6069_002746 [Aspergillus lentulus]|nr:hypothetical protein CNMCM6069_002746 [Aspergillus lentulus]
MAVSTADHSATAVGIYMENGSGGMVSDLTFTGGNIGFLAGSQQFTAINLQFTSCLTTIKSIWNWGFTWKNIYVLSCYIAIDATEYSGVGNQGTGSIAVVDSHFNGVPYAITIAHTADEQPNIVLDNLLIENPASVVLISGGETILPGSTGALYFNSWVSGYRFLPDGSAGKSNGFINPAPIKPSLLVDGSGAFFRKPKPQYVGETPVVATDGTGDQAMAISELLSSYRASVIFFPAGVYLVESTVHIPVGSKIIGSGWSQIMGTGSAFEDESKPNVVVRVGQKGDQGVVEITDMLFTVKGATAGAALMEWNVHGSNQGSAAMWDSRFRVGGANGSNLGLANCPIGGDAVNKKCMGASMLMHITSDASGYFENVWAWVADHDLDSPLNALATESPAGVPLPISQSTLDGAYLSSLRGQRGSTARPASMHKFLNSTDVFIYSAGFYSFFQGYDESCVSDEHCQQSLIQTNYAKGLWIYNIFTKGNVEIVSPEGGLPALLFNATTRNGFTSEIAAWLSLSTGGGDIGSDGDDSGAVYIDPVIWSEPDDGRNISCYPPCTYILPPTTLPTPTTFVYPTLVTDIRVGYEVPTAYVYLGNTTTTTTYIMSTTMTTRDSGCRDPFIIPIPSIIQGAFNITWSPLVRNSTTYPGTVVPFYPPPWTPEPPSSTPSPTSTSTSTTTTGGGSKTTGSHDLDYPHVTHHRGPPKRPSRNALTARSVAAGVIRALVDSLTESFTCVNLAGRTVGGLDSPNDFPNDPNDTPDDDDPNDDPSSSMSECSTATYSSCSTACITASSTNIMGCDTTGTSIVSTYTLPPILVCTVETWSDAGYTASDVAADWAAGSSIYSSVHFGSTSGPITSGPGPTSAGGGGGGSGTVTTITKVVIETETLTTTYAASLGVVGMAAAWQLGYRNFPVSDYDLDFYSVSETRNICERKFSTEYGAASPRPKTWSDIPQSVTFFSILDVLSTKYTNCIYTNAAAPSPGDGGTVRCDGLTFCRVILRRDRPWGVIQICWLGG